MDKVTYSGLLREAVCEECGAVFGATEFEAAKEHDQNPCNE